MIHINFTISYIEIYIFFINLITFIIYSIDKFRAIIKASHNRISENTLLLLALFGGIIGAIISMIFFRHKIKKLSFILKFIIVFIIQCLILYYLKINHII